MAQTPPADSSTFVENLTASTLVITPVSPAAQVTSEPTSGNHSLPPASFPSTLVEQEGDCTYRDDIGPSDAPRDGLLVSCEGDLPCNSIALSPPQSPVLDDFPSVNDDFLDSPQSGVAQVAASNPDHLLNFAKRPRTQNQIIFPNSSCACACSALEAVTATATASAFAAAAAVAAEAAQAATAKFRKCCGGNCRCPPGGCHCPQTAVPSGSYLCQMSDKVNCSHIKTLARSLNAALVAATSHAPCSASGLPSDKSSNDQSSPSCCCTISNVPCNTQPSPVLKAALPGTGKAYQPTAPSPKPSRTALASNTDHGLSSARKESLSVPATSNVSPSTNHRIKQTERDRPFVCTKCSATFLFKQNRDRHVVEVHLGHRPHKCPYPKCEAAFKNLSGLKQHQKTVHEKARPFKCEKCESAFGQRNHLRQHVLVVHDKVKMFHCEICGMSFSNVGNRTQHMKRRHSEAAAVRTLSRSQQYHQQQRLQRHQKQPLQALLNTGQTNRSQEDNAHAENNATSSSSPGMETDAPVENSTADCRSGRPGK